MKYTPGPWEISKHATPDYAPQFGVYAECEAHHDLAIVKGENAKANAALITAAPDLLAQLKALVVQIEASGLVVPPGVRDAIRKAEGGAL